MHFGISGGGVGLIGIFVLFSAGMLVFTIVVTVIIRVVRGRDDMPDEPSTDVNRRAPEDDYIL